MIKDCKAEPFENSDLPILAGKTDSNVANGLADAGKPYRIKDTAAPGVRLICDGDTVIATVANAPRSVAAVMAAAPALLAHLEWAAKFLQPLIGGSAQYDAILATIASAREGV